MAGRSDIAMDDQVALDRYCLGAIVVEIDASPKATRCRLASHRERVWRPNNRQRGRVLVLFFEPARWQPILPLGFGPTLAKRTTASGSEEQGYRGELHGCFEFGHQDFLTLDALSYRCTANNVSTVALPAESLERALNSPSYLYPPDGTG